MNTITVWLLMAMPTGGASSYYYEIHPAVVVERFATKDDCERVAKWVKDYNRGGRVHGCIDAKVPAQGVPK